MDQLKPNFGNRSHLFYMRDENLAYASMWLLQSRQYQPLLCLFTLLFPLLFFFFFFFYLPKSPSYSFPLFSSPPRQIQVLFLFDFPLPIPSLPQTIFVTLYLLFFHWSPISFITTFSARRLLQAVWRYFHDMYRKVITATLHGARIQLQTLQKM